VNVIAYVVGDFISAKLESLFKLTCLHLSSGQST